MEREIGKFVRWAKPITLDLAKMPLEASRKAMSVLLPGAQSESLVEIPTEDAPTQEVLDLRMQSF